VPLYWGASENSERPMSPDSLVLMARSVEVDVGAQSIEIDPVLPLSSVDLVARELFDKQEADTLCIG
jgi:hypothetical protein